MPNLINKDHCCGCAACANKCPKQAISMQPNNEGFLHPVIDTSLCVECGACEKACPGLAPAQGEYTEFSPKAFIVQHKDDSIRYQSTSGGAFTAIAEGVIRKGGLVFGAVMTDYLKVKHSVVVSVSDLAKFRNSKYVQSDIGDCYKQAKIYLQAGKLVCFSGTPCQINGLYKFLGQDYENLIAVDICCKSVPSPLIFEKYKEFKSKQKRKPAYIVFRDKKRGFSYCTMAHYATKDAKYTGASYYRRGSESDEWLRLFLSGKITRMSCFTCTYQTESRVGDFTLWDKWETTDVAPEWNDNKGTTNVVVWSEKGKNFFDAVSERIRFCEFPFEQAGGARGGIRHQEPKPYRKQLFDDANSMSAESFFEKYAPYSMKVRLYQFGRYLIWRLHLHNLIRNIKHLVIHRKK